MILEKPTKPYRSKSGMWLTGGLFRERLQQRPGELTYYEPVFSLVGDFPGLINCRRTFVDLMDPTGYTWAITYLGEWAHWEQLMKQNWFSSEVDKWRQEIEIKLEAEAIRTARSIANDPDNKNQLTAARFMHSLTAKTAATKRGRPSKAEVAAAVEQEVRKASEFDDDLERMQLTVIPGGKH